MAKRPHNSTEDIQQMMLDKYKPETMDELQDAMKDVFGSMFEAMLQGEMTSHLGFESNDHNSDKMTTNRRNGSGKKKVITKFGEVPINTPRDREGTFDSKLIPKRTRNASEYEDKVISMYAKGMSQRDIAATIKDIYGSNISHEAISTITDSVIQEQREWQARPLKSLYTFVYVDCMYVPIKSDRGSKKCAVYVILGVDVNGHKEILGLWIGETEGKHVWMNIFDEIKARGVEDIIFLSMDGVSGLEDGAKSIFPDILVQRCLVHISRNAIKYVSTKDYKAFCKDIKAVYGAVSLQAAESAFESFKDKWSCYPGAVDTWNNNWRFVEQLFDYPSDVRKVMYTTNAIESVNSSLRKVVKKGAFYDETAALKLLYLRVKELDKKWNGGTIRNWARVRNQLYLMPGIQERIERNL
jgi:transposase-like protein